MTCRGTVFDIKRFAVHDGPGIRTTVFLKGCPLRCWWCHNPEGISAKPDLMYFEIKCIQCKMCVDSCPINAITFEKNAPIIDRQICDYCGKCTEVCPTGALKLIGSEFTVEELIQEIEKDILLYDNSGGGVTFSGGDPLYQHQFLKEVLQECKKKGIHTVLDTSGCAPKEIFFSVAEYVDLFLYDLKLFDTEKHKKYTGVSNHFIKENLKGLTEIGRGKDVILRFPVITGITDTEENISELVEFVSSLKDIKEINLLPFHDVSEKYKRLDLDYKMPVQHAPSKEKLKFIKESFEKIGLYVKV